MKDFFKKYIPLSFMISLPLALLSFLLLYRCRTNSALADRVSGGVGAVLRRAMATLTNSLPVSLAEILVIALVLGVIALVFISLFAVRRARTRVRILLHIFAFAFTMYSWYAVAFGASYHTQPINEKMGFDIVEVDETDLDTLATYLALELNSLAPCVGAAGEGSAMQYGTRELSEKAVLAYTEFLDDYPIFENFESYVKPVMLSELMAYAGLLGMYTYFTGESNVSVVYPDYCIPSAVIHEFAHQRGVAREDEANFLAYTACSYSDDAYIRYSGYLNLFEYTASALSRTDKARVSEIYSMLDKTVLEDLKAYSEFYYAHKSTLLRDVSSFFNDTYLKANGTAGVVSYSMVVRLSVSYYKSIGTIP